VIQFHSIEADTLN